MIVYVVADLTEKQNKRNWLTLFRISFGEEEAVMHVFKLNSWNLLKNLKYALTGVSKYGFCFCIIWSSDGLTYRGCVEPV